MLDSNYTTATDKCKSLYNIVSLKYIINVCMCVLMSHIFSKNMCVLQTSLEEHHERVGVRFVWASGFQQICSPKYTCELQGRISQNSLVVQLSDEGNLKMTLGGRVFVLAFFVHLSRLLFVNATTV